MELPRGMKDFEGKENAAIEHIRSHFRRLSHLYGFSFMDPSPIELLSTLETKSGPGIRDEIYYFRDKGDREVALRFDFTMGPHKICRIPKVDEAASQDLSIWWGVSV